MTTANIKSYFRLLLDAFARGGETAVIEEALTTNFSFLESLKRPEEPFSAMTSQMIDAFRDELALI
jgi:hypothetical protein